MYRLKEDDPELKPWDERLTELAGEPDDIDEMLSEIEQKFFEEEQGEAKGQLELFGALLTDLAGRKRDEEDPTHRVLTREGRQLEGSWDDIVTLMRDANVSYAGRSTQDFMTTEARRGYGLTGVTIPTGDAESFIRGSADAGLLRILQ